MIHCQCKKLYIVSITQTIIRCQSNIFNDLYDRLTIMIDRPCKNLHSENVYELNSYYKLHTWMVAPLAYQKGPLTPYSQATLELCRIVAAQVHFRTNSMLI